MGIKFIHPLKKVTCNFCFSKFYLSDAHIRDERPGTQLEPDDYIKNFLGLDNAPDAPPFIVPDKYLFRSFILKILDIHFRRICPRCHMPLSKSTASGEISTKTIAIVGGRSSGKSNYFAILIRHLRNLIGDEVGFVVLEQDTYCTNTHKTVSSNKIYEERYDSRLNKKLAIDQTHSATTDRQTRIPLIYRIKFDQNNFLDSKIIDLVIYDAAGEDIEEKDRIFSYYNYIFGSSGIMFLIDPTDYDEVKDSLPEDIKNMLPDKSISKDSELIVEEVISLFDSYVEKGVMSQKINIPVAFVLSKSDLLKHILDFGSEILEDSDHCNGFNEEDINSVSEEVRDLISQWQSPRLMNLADKFFTEKKFFAVSALGTLPDKDSLSIGQTITSSRVADPILWLFWKNKLISSISERELSHFNRIILEVISTIIVSLIIYNDIIYYWKFFHAPLIYLIASAIVGGYSILINKSKDFCIKNSLLMFLGTFVFMLFIPYKYSRNANMLMTGWVITIIIQKIIYHIKIDQSFILKTNKYSKNILICVHIIVPMIITIIIFNIL